MITIEEIKQDYSCYENISVFTDSHMISSSPLLLTNNLSIKNILNDLINLIHLDKSPGFNNRATISQLEEIEFNRFMLAEGHNEIKSIYEYLDSSYMKNNIKFIYCSDIEFDYNIIRYSSFSNITHEVNNFITFVIGSKCNNEKELMKLCVSVIDCILMQRLRDHCNVSYGYNKSIMTDRNSPEVLILPYSRSISDIKLLADFYIALFKTLDSIFDLKYDDFRDLYSNTDIGEICKESLNIYDILQKIYNFSIETSTTEEDYYELLKNIYN